MYIRKKSWGYGWNTFNLVSREITYPYNYEAFAVAFVVAFVVVADTSKNSVVKDQDYWLNLACPSFASSDLDLFCLIHMHLKWLPN